MKSVSARAAAPLARWLLLASLSALVAACSFSYSSEKFSDSSSASSDSSASSSPGAKGRAYQNDVSDYTTAYVKSSHDLTSFRSGLGNLARKRGVTDWEDDENTWLGIGAGLGRAKVSKVELDVYKTNLSGGDARHAASIQKGYDSVD
jgi:hypothetical protein